MISVIIVDDHPVVAHGLKSYFETSGSIIVKGIANTAKECIGLLNIVTPDVILLDMKLPDSSGIELGKIIFDNCPCSKIIVLSSYNQQYYINAMLKLGVQGYLLKNTPPNIIIDAIIQVHEGENYFCKEVNKLLVPTDDNLFLSTREIEVLKLIAQGLTNQQIAEKLFISHLTVDSHRKNLIIKLGAKNTASLINIAGVQGYLS